MTRYATVNLIYGTGRGNLKCNGDTDFPAFPLQETQLQVLERMQPEQLRDR